MDAQTVEVLEEVRAQLVEATSPEKKKAIAAEKKALVKDKLRPFFKKIGVKKVRYKTTFGLSGYVEAWLNWDPDNPETGDKFPEALRVIALKSIYGSGFKAKYKGSAGNITPHGMSMSVAQWEKTLEQAKGKM